MSGDSGAGASASAVISVSSPAAALRRGFALALADLLLCLAIWVPCETRGPHAIFTSAALHGLPYMGCLTWAAMADARSLRVLSEPTALTSRDGSMNVQDFPPTTDDSAGEALIAAGGAVLAERRSDIPGRF